MTRFLQLLLLGALLVPPAAAQQPYSISWPEGDPIWEFDVLPPRLSTGPNGSGVEIRNVRYNGRLVMKRGHVPILNVKYESGCNCFRDWQDAEVRFVARRDGNVPITPNWIIESTPGTVATMCDVAPTNCTDTDGDGEVDSCNDVGSFKGVGVERFETFLRLTTHMSAGWYRYTMRWEFYEGGTIRPLFGFTSTGGACTTNPRRHHAYWRFDFDIEGADNDYIVEHLHSGSDAPYEVETTRTWASGEGEEPFAWSVMDTQSERGYTVTPSESDLLTPADPETGNPALDDFAREDVVAALFDPHGEIDDGTSACTARFTEVNNPNPIVNDETIYNADVVLWYRSGITKPDIDPGHCYESGPILTPVGDWSAPPPVDTEQGAAPTAYTLQDAYPNPFDQTTTIRFAVEAAQRVTLTLYDALGREVRPLYEGTPPAGVMQSVVMDGSALPSGVYTVRIEGDGFAGSTRVVLLK